MTSHDESPEKSDPPASDTEWAEGTELPVQRRMVAPPTGWAAMAAWSYWRHSPWGDPPPFLTAPVQSDEEAREAGAQRDGDGLPPRGHQPDTRGAKVPRRRRIVAMIVIEVLAVFGIIGAIVSSAAHDAALGMLALGVALVANVALWLWARSARRRPTPGERDTPGGHR